MNDSPLPVGQPVVQPAPMGLHGEARSVHPVRSGVARRPPSTFRYAGRDWKEVGRLRWEVTSASEPTSYILDAEEGKCSCWQGQRYPHRPCLHIIALRNFLAKWRKDNPDPTNA